MGIRCSYRIAGIGLHIRLPEEWELIPAGRFGCFRTDHTFPGVQVEIRAAESLQREKGTLIYADESQHIRTDRGDILRYVGNYGFSGMKSAVYCQKYREGTRGDYTVCFSGKHRMAEEEFLLSSIGLEHILADYGRVILHSSFLIYKGKGIIFSAPSGTGKSTQAELWRRSRRDVEIINGDRSVLSCDGGAAQAHGIVFCGTSGISLNKSAPIRALVVLRQGKENCIRLLHPAVAFALLFAECGVNRWSKRDTGEVTALLERIVNRVPVFYYSCLPDISAVDVLEEAMDRYEASDTDEERGIDIWKTEDGKGISR